MLKILLKLTLFFTVFFIISLVLSKVYTSVVMKNSTLNRVERQLNNFDGVIKRLIIGDSHPRSSIHPQVLENSFLFTSPGEDYIQTYYKLNYILSESDHRDEIEIILLQLDLHTFSSFRKYRYDNDEYYWSKYIDYIQLGFETGDLSYYFSKWLLGNVFSYYSGRKDLFEYIYAIVILKGQVKQEEMISGFVPFHNDFSKVGDPARRAKNRNAFLYKDHNLFDEDIADYLTRTIELCRTHGKRLVFVSYPTTRIYYDVATGYFRGGTYAEKIDSLLASYSDIPLLDFHDLYFDRDTLFSDSDHLNLMGAELFSREMEAALSSLKYCE